MRAIGVLGYAAADTQVVSGHQTNPFLNTCHPPCGLLASPVMGGNHISEPECSEPTTRQRHWPKHIRTGNAARHTSVDADCQNMSASIDNNNCLPAGLFALFNLGD